MENVFVDLSKLKVELVKKIDQLIKSHLSERKKTFLIYSYLEF